MDNLSKTKKLVYAALLLALGMVLPFLTGQLHSIGNMLCPMHFPVFIAGLICGWQYGLAVGFCLPLLRSVIFSMPAIYPAAVSMAFEMATYGLSIALIHNNLRGKLRHIKVLYVSLASSMLLGRIVYGISRFLMLELVGTKFTFAMFFANEFVNAWPGILLQLIIIPPLVRKIHLIK